MTGLTSRVSATVESPRGDGFNIDTEAPLLKDSANKGADRISSRIRKCRAA